MASLAISLGCIEMRQGESSAVRRSPPCPPPAPTPAPTSAARPRRATARFLPHRHRHLRRRQRRDHRHAQRHRMPHQKILGSELWQSAGCRQRHRRGKHHHQTQHHQQRVTHTNGTSTPRRMIGLPAHPVAHGHAMAPSGNAAAAPTPQHAAARMPGHHRCGPREQALRRRSCHHLAAISGSARAGATKTCARCS